MWFCDSACRGFCTHLLVIDYNNIIEICILIIIVGQEFRAVFLSTSEPILDGKILNPTKSLSNKFVFNTAITRAQSLIVSVGNPFLLLEMEQHMIQTYGRNHQVRCWSNYLKKCLSNGTVQFDDLLLLTEEQKLLTLKKLQEVVDRQLKSECLSVQNVPMKNNELLPRAMAPPIPTGKREKKRKKRNARQSDCLAGSVTVADKDFNTRQQHKAVTSDVQVRYFIIIINKHKYELLLSID